MLLVDVANTTKLMGDGPDHTAIIQGVSRCSTDAKEQNASPLHAPERTCGSPSHRVQKDRERGAQFLNFGGKREGNSWSRKLAKVLNYLSIVGTAKLGS